MKTMIPMLDRSSGPGRPGSISCETISPPWSLDEVWRMKKPCKPPPPDSSSILATPWHSNHILILSHVPPPVQSFSHEAVLAGQTRATPSFCQPRQAALGHIDQGRGLVGGTQCCTISATPNAGAERSHRASNGSEGERGSEKTIVFHMLSTHMRPRPLLVLFKTHCHCPGEAPSPFHAQCSADRPDWRWRPHVSDTL